jgi:hypothetical protein
MDQIIEKKLVWGGWAVKYKKFVQFKDCLLPTLMNGQNKLADVQKMFNDQWGMVAESNVEYKKN